ncbi:MAG: hypothetical protein AAF721_14965 [Myxococcota bacterium]
MRLASALTCCLAVAAGCDTASQPETLPAAPLTAFRCSASDLPALGGLDSVTLSGTSRITSSDWTFDVFTNGKLGVGGEVYVGGGLYSASGSIAMRAGAQILGDLVESGPEIPAYVPETEAEYVERNSHNAQIGLTAGGNTPLVSGKLTLSGADALQFPHYFYDVDGISLSGGSQVSLSYTVTYVFVDGAIEISGGSSIGTSSARHLLIVSLSDEPIVISGASTSVLARIYAPLAPIQITDGARVEGAVVGATLQMSGDSTVEVTQDGLHIWYPC